MNKTADDIINSIIERREALEDKTHKTVIKELGKFMLPDPEFGDLKLSVMPFENNGGRIPLPKGFEIWEESLNKIMEQVPLVEGANTHYVTIDSKFFSRDGFLRREGIHADGNFCVDPSFKRATWGGLMAAPTWSGMSFDAENYMAVMDWVLPYDIKIPIGEYISSEKGGIFAVSTEVGCQGWHGDFHGRVESEGCYGFMHDQLTEDRKVVFQKDVLYFMTSNTPHETLTISRGKRRTFMRITLNHEYPNKILTFMEKLGGKDE